MFDTTQVAELHKTQDTCPRSILLSLKTDLKGLETESREYQERLFGPILGYLGFSYLSWPPLFGIRWWGKLVAFSCLTLSQIGSF